MGDKSTNSTVLLLAALAQVGSQAILMQATPQILFKHYKGDGAKTVLALNQMTSAAAVLEFALNPLFGSLSDSHGRKLFLCLAPIATILCRAAVVHKPGPGTVAVGRLVTGALVPAFMTALSASAVDMLRDDHQKLTALTGRVQMINGCALVLGSVLGGRLAAKDIRIPYAVSVLLGAVSLALVLGGYRETLTEKERKPFHVKKVNPLSFLELFRRHPLLARLAAIYALGQTPMNMGEVDSMFSREVRKWGPTQIGNFVGAQGVAYMVSGASIGAAVKQLGRQKLAGLSSLLTCLSLFAYARADTTAKAYATLLLLGGPGQMRQAPVDASIAAKAMSLGVGQGQLAAEKANLSAAVRALTPLLCGWAYALGSKNGIPALPYYIIGTFLAIARGLIGLEKWEL